MKKTVLMMVIGLGAAFAAQADLIYFKVNAFAWTGGPKYFDYAGLCVAKSDGTYVDRLQIKTSATSSESGDMVWAEDRYHAEGWADIAKEEWQSDDYVFYVDAYDTSSGEWVEVYGYSADTAKTYAQLFEQGSIYIPGSTDPQDVKPWNVPEPTSGVLLLLGSALLALRRKSRLKVVACSLFLMPFLCAFGAVDDTLITFGTKGPDKYLDGTTVQDGESYALVWTKTGATFAGLTADGKAIGDDSKVVVFAPIAKDGHCPKAIFELDKTLMAQYKGGSFALYLVDTRLASGQLGGVNDANGLPVAVNGYGALADGMVANGETEPVVAVTTKSAVPADAPQPTITAIKVVGDNVFLTVKNTVPYLQYAARERIFAQSQNSPAPSYGSEQNMHSPATQGDAEAEIIVIAPKKGDSGFYSVGRK